MGRSAHPPLRVAVVGAGLGGLSVAHAIRREAAARERSLELEVWEARERPGGLLGTSNDDGFLVERAANAFRTGLGPTADLVERLDLRGEQVHADPAANRRYVFHGGQLHLLPSDPISLLNFTPMSREGRLRVMAEPFLAARVDHEESVYDYAARHIGPEAAHVLLGTMVRGVYGGNAHELSVDAAFPIMREMERDHRSLVIAAIAGMPERMRERKTTWSFRAGMRVILDRLSDDLGAALRSGTPAQELAVDPASGRYLLRSADGVGHVFDAIVLAVPARAAADLLETIDASAAHEIRGIPSAPIAVVALAFAREAWRSVPDGFGFLVAPGEDLEILGALIESNVFPGRSPPGTVLIRVIMGGVDHPELVGRTDAELKDIALDGLDRAWGITGAPLHTWVIRQGSGIPQYVMGHGARLARIEQRLRPFPGIHIAGNAFRGVAVGKLVEDAESVAAALWSAPAGVSEEVA